MSETVSITVPHTLTRDEAKERIDTGFVKVQEQLPIRAVDIKQSWRDDTMDFSAGLLGTSLQGTVTVADDCVTIDIRMPRLLAKLSNGIVDQVKRGTRLLLEKK